MIEATPTNPKAVRAATTLRNLQREERLTVQGPVRKPTKDEMSHRRGGGGEGLALIFIPAGGGGDPSPGPPPPLPPQLKCS